MSETIVQVTSEEYRMDLAMEGKGDVLEEVIQLSSNEETKDEVKSKVMSHNKNFLVYFYQPQDTGKNENDYAVAEHIPYDPMTRNAYIRKVMFITLICFLITGVAVGIVYNVLDLYRLFRQNNLMFVIIGAVGCLIMNCVISCSKCSARFPINYITLLMFVFFETIMLAAITVRYKTHIILYAFVITTLIVFVCLCIACTSFDFTRFFLYIVVIGLVVGLLASSTMIMMYIFNYRYTPLTIGIMAVVTIAQCVMLIMQLQMIIGGRAVELAETEHVMGAFLLYSTIISILMLVMQILGLSMD